MTNGARRERSRQTEAAILLVCVAFLLSCGENLDRGTKPAASPQSPLLFLPTRLTSSWWRLHRPRPLTLISHLATSLPIDGFPGDAAVKDEKTQWGIDERRRDSELHTIGRQTTAGGAETGKSRGSVYPCSGAAGRVDSRLDEALQLFFPSLSHVFGSLPLSRCGRGWGGDEETWREGRRGIRHR
jgi:hypothetical protein